MLRDFTPHLNPLPWEERGEQRRMLRSRRERPDGRLSSWRRGEGEGEELVQFKNEGIAYEHVFTTQGFDEAYSIMYHLRPPTRVRNVELVKQWEPKKVTDSPLRHHHLKTANIPRRGDLYTGRVP